MATVEERLAALEAVVFPAAADPPPYVEPVTATVTTKDGKTITSTSGTKAQLEALIAAKSPGK